MQTFYSIPALISLYPNGVIDKLVSNKLIDWVCRAGQIGSRSGGWQGNFLFPSQLGFVAQMKFLAEKYHNSEKYCVTMEARIFR